uniref:Reverse transcriptase domain-containing protein n=1 Tax=Cannabis sativa TaxID=3483 RepID=A0A803P8S6_CANSA
MDNHDNMEVDNGRRFEILLEGDDDDGGLRYEAEETELSYFGDRWCLVGRFLTDKALDFMAMQHKMASLWRLGRGLYVKELDHNLYLFQFYHDVDIDRVIEGNPWTFDRAPLVFSRLKIGEAPRNVVLNTLDFCIQLHGMTIGFMSAKVVKDIGNYVGTFVEAEQLHGGDMRNNLEENMAKKVGSGSNKDMGIDEGEVEGDIDTDGELFILENKRKRVNIGITIGLTTSGPNNNGSMEMLEETLEVYGSFAVEAQGRSGGLALLWKCQDEGRVVGFSQHHIDFMVGREGFEKTLLSCNLTDVELVGYQFTLEKGRGTSNWIELRLDRALVSSTWYQSFPNTRLINLDTSPSDHNPLCLELEVQNVVPPIRRFRFENAWLKEPLCFEIVHDCWNHHGNGNITSKIEACATKLATWGKGVTGNFKKRIQLCRKELKLLKNKRDEASIQRYSEEGDQNSKYFHRAASKRRSANQIVKLKDNVGNWKEWGSGLEGVMVDYFSHLFSDKSPGPDGMTPAFFQKCWSIVSKDVVDFIQHFFISGQIEQGCSEANVVLIPKKIVPERMSDLRPIALCNVLYKTITKVLANRMNHQMHEIVSETQNAFIPDRLISDNILVSFEILHYLKRKRKGKEGYMVLKLDLSKAYDRIEWPFLEKILAKLGFCDEWISLVMKCVSSARYMVTHGGREMGPIFPSRGIRQGDPLSPYLFIICAEGLSSLIRSYEARGWIHGCKVSNGALRVSHMLFADDSYLYCKATIINTDDTSRTSINHFLQMSQADDRSMYLVLPSTMGRNKTTALGYLRDRVRRKLQGWDSKILSRAGKEVLIKSVAQALPSYAMSVFLLPWEISRDIESLLAKFWWKGSSGDARGISWMSWDRMCDHKSNGGMGFCNFRDFNLALLGKQGWRFITRPNSLASCIFKARYYPRGSFFNAELGNNPSFVCRSVWEARPLIRNGVRWCVGDGSGINVLGEPWLPDPDNPFIISDHPALQNAKVENLFSLGGKEWDFPSCDHLCWWKEGSGVYSVRSAYQILQESKGRGDDGAATGFWKQLWELKIPPKVKNLVWRAGVACLPTLAQLVTKRVAEVWERVGIGTIGADGGSFADWCTAIFLKQSAEMRCLIATLCWAIWGAINDRIWQKKLVSASAIVASAKCFLDQWHIAQKSQIETSWSGLQVKDGVEQWAKPVENSIKINVDATIFEEQNHFGLACVIRDHNGFLLTALTRLFRGAIHRMVAEALSFREALSWLKTHQRHMAVIETDCLLVVQALRSSIHTSSPFGEIITKCKNLLAQVRNVSFNFVKRSANVVAHEISSIYVTS